MRYRFEVSSRSSRQAAASGLRNFSRLAGTPGPQLQAAAGRLENDQLPRSHPRAPGPHRMAAGAGEIGLSRTDLRKSSDD